MTPMVVIGGPHDGHWVDSYYSDKPFHAIPVYPRCSALASAEAPACGPCITEAVYAKCAFADDGGTYYAWVHPSVKYPIRNLLAGYLAARKEPTDG